MSHHPAEETIMKLLKDHNDVALLLEKHDEGLLENPVEDQGQQPVASDAGIIKQIPESLRPPTVTRSSLEFEGTQGS